MLISQHYVYDKGWDYGMQAQASAKASKTSEE